MVEVARTLVVLEFPGGGTAGRVRSMGLERLDLRVRYLFDEVRPRRTAIDDYAGELLAASGAEQVAMVVAYCGAVPIARQLAEHCLRVGGRRPAVLALNPEATLAEGVAGLLGRMLTKAGVPQELADGLTASGETVRDRVADALPAVESALAEAYARPPLNLATAAGPLAAMQADWLAHLAAACDPAQLPPDERELHVIAADHPCPPGCPARHEGVDVPQRGFFAADETFRALADALHE
ncbi:hypothetical protein [Kitasatospora viridis]|uniref:Uncharacterized protein n=1 Tax=Kitasatospora viridis TaxID=281105 RepID=A0A561TST0_9ACTN|nr:hypothetical protein [Kitasatospora viridis]TWF90173.1 hypothetical protein FHX73_13217 [Kitasatospora viridis]